MKNVVQFKYQGERVTGHVIGSYYDPGYRCGMLIVGIVSTGKVIELRPNEVTYVS